MKINCELIATEINKSSIEKLANIYKKNKPPKVALFYVGENKLTEIFINKKVELAKKFRIKFEVVHFKNLPLFQEFACKLRKVANSHEFQAVILQQPLPAELCSDTLLNFIPDIKEIEGCKYRTYFPSPVGLTTLSIIKYCQTDFKKWEIKKNDAEFFKKNFKRKFVVLAGRGQTTGQPIARTLVHYKMALVITHSQTPEPELFYKQSDILICTTGHSILNKECIKAGSVIINFGYHREENKTKGDYDEDEIKDLAGFYTPIINGTGPIMLAYLMKNIVSAYTRQIKD